MIELNDLLNIDNMKIYQNKSWFSFSLDSVLLASYIKVNERTYNILDLCTGNAPIPLILSKRCNANIKGIEIQEDIYKLAIDSVKLNQLDNRIKIIHDDALEYYKKTESDQYDIITCNPPYFTLKNNMTKNEDIHKTIARHEVKIRLEDILIISKKLLKNNGTLALIHRTERFVEILELYRKYNIEPKKIRFIYPKDNSESNMFIIEGTKNGKPGLVIEKPIIVHNDDGTYKDEIKRIFNGEFNESKELPR